MLAGSMTPTEHSDTELNGILDALQSAASTTFDRARPIPAAVNHAASFLAHERHSVFEREWICVGRRDELASPGDFLTHDIAGVSVLVVCDEDSTRRAFVNACAHRFACLVEAERGSKNRFTCPYHAWTYDTRGKLLRAPYMEMKQGFDPDLHQLRPLQLAEWEGFVYVTLAETPHKQPAEALEPLRRGVVGRYDMSCYRTVLREKMRWRANWKNLVENFIESYHVPMAHGKTFAQHGKPLADYTCGEDSLHYCYHRAPQASDTGLGAAHPENPRLENEWRRMMVDFCVFPNHLVTLMPDYLWYISVQPRGCGEFDATWGLAVPPEVLADVPADEYDAWLHDFRNYMEIANNEDRTIVEALYRGSAAPRLPQGTYHPIERNLWQFTCYLAAACGAAAPDNSGSAG